MQKDRIAMIKEVQAEMNSIVVERRELTSLNRDIPTTADTICYLHICCRVEHIKLVKMYLFIREKIKNGWVHTF